MTANIIHLMYVQYRIGKIYHKFPLLNEETVIDTKENNYRFLLPLMIDVQFVIGSRKYDILCTQLVKCHI